MIIRIRVCIPTFNNPATIQRVVEECLEKTPFPILVIDDGSDRPVQEILHGPAFNEALESQRLEIIRTVENNGKGNAIQVAFKDSVGKGFTHALTFDADGQHLVSEIPKMAEAARENPWNLILGNRILLSENIPQISKFGRNFSNFWVRYQTHFSIKDSQSGFRIYPLIHCQNISFFTKKFDFEIEVLIRLLWKNVGIKEVDIAVYYPPPAERVSHFNKFRDNVRISLLNTLLVILSLFKNASRPATAAWSIGLGAFIGCTPFFGFQGWIAISLAPIFKLNVPLLVLGTLISFPPLIPFLIAGSITTGSYLLGHSIADIPADALALHPQHFFYDWLIGSMVIGTIVGGILGLATYFLVRSSSKRKVAPKNWSGTTRGGVIGNTFLKWTIKFFGLRAGYFCLLFICPYFYFFAPKGRRASNEYFKMIQPNWSWARRQAAVIKHFFTFGTLLLDRVYCSFYPDLKLKSASNGFENIRTSVDKKNGLILLGAHLGAWDLASRCLQEHELPVDFFAVEFVAQGLTFDKVKGANAESPKNTLAVNSARMPILMIHDLLKDGKALGLMCDRPMGNHYELIPFFGKLAAFDTTAFQLAASCRSPLVFSFGFRAGYQSYEFYSSASKNYIYQKHLSKEVQCLQWLKEFTSTLESFVKRYPYQWLNFYPLWSSLPDSLDREQTKSRRNYLLEELNLPSAGGSASEPGVEPIYESRSLR